jgi:hypothetical protein
MVQTTFGRSVPLRLLGTMERDHVTTRLWMLPHVSIWLFLLTITWPSSGSTARIAPNAPLQRRVEHTRYERGE